MRLRQAQNDNMIFNNKTGQEWDEFRIGLNNQSLIKTRQFSLMLDILSSTIELLNEHQHDKTAQRYYVFNFLSKEPSEVCVLGFNFQIDHQIFYMADKNISTAPSSSSRYWFPRMPKQVYKTARDLTSIIKHTSTSHVIHQTWSHLHLTALNVYINPMNEWMW